MMPYGLISDILFSVFEGIRDHRPTLNLLCTEVGCCCSYCFSTALGVSHPSPLATPPQPTIKVDRYIWIIATYFYHITAKLRLVSCKWCRKLEYPAKTTATFNNIYKCYLILNETDMKIHLHRITFIFGR